MTLSRAVRSGLGFATVLCAVSVSASTDPQRQPMYFAAAELRTEVAQPQNGLAASMLSAGIRMQVFIVHRDATGEVELHASLEHFYIAQAGEAEVLLGGRVIRNHQTAPGEWRGGEIVHGKAYRMKPGDVLWIPPGTPHQVFVPKNGSFQYIGLNANTKLVP